MLSRVWFRLGSRGRIATFTIATSSTAMSIPASTTGGTNRPRSGVAELSRPSVSGIRRGRARVRSERIRAGLAESADRTGCSGDCRAVRSCPRARRRDGPCPKPTARGKPMRGPCTWPAPGPRFFSTFLIRNVAHSLKPTEDLLPVPEHDRGQGYARWRLTWPHGEDHADGD